jgi:hypothetical protein
MGVDSGRSFGKYLLGNCRKGVQSIEYVLRWTDTVSGGKAASPLELQALAEQSLLADSPTYFERNNCVLTWRIV